MAIMDLKEQEPKEENPKALSSKFFVGSEEGDLLYADWFLEKKSNEEKGKL